MTSKVSIAFLARNTFEWARRTRPAVATRLIAYMRHVSLTTFVASLTDVTSCHSARQVRGHVIVPSNIFVEYVQTIDGHDSTFKHNVVAT